MRPHSQHCLCSRTLTARFLPGYEGVSEMRYRRSCRANPRLKCNQRLRDDSATGYLAYLEGPLREIGHMHRHVSDVMRGIYH